ncbi:hypothetical protein E4634_20925 [Mangrovimicrobium sediminis]|uniref:Phosphatidate cytidylyltransferase n=1 Tax=Mangrovimicrobium sediminis TaxID=2562682 RepID=A0A4Z0LTA9_9GAMM|nr:hypothetical protein [Haliea sp. SAOS-164]TGD70613.1 hypothetical protein E4634_20925 [Haliea sp. SAOS-164]
MLRSGSYTKPKPHSLIGALIVSVLVWAGAYISSFVGYLLALLSLVMIIVVVITDSVWPTERKQENAVVFALFWGCMIGGILPFIIVKYVEGGFEALYELL